MCDARSAEYLSTGETIMYGDVNASAAYIFLEGNNCWDMHSTRLMII